MTTLHPLAGKVALITGSGRGMGRQNAIELASRGADLVINYSSSAKSAEEVVKTITDMGRKAIAIQADISQPSQIASLFEQATNHYGHIDIVVSNSGLEHFGNVDEVTPEEFDRIFAVNTRGQFFVAQQAHKHLSVGGRLILLSSISAQARGVRNHSVYAGSKAAVEAFARGLATGESRSPVVIPLLMPAFTDFGDKRITVNAIAPGGVKTAMYVEAARKYIPGAEGGPNGEGRWSDEKVEEAVANFTPLGRVAVPDDIARVVAFLASEDGGWINGEFS
jgi:tetrahydroxynaphthalene reductase